MMIFGFLPQNLKTKAVAVAFSTAWLRSEVGPRVEDDLIVEHWACRHDVGLLAQVRSRCSAGAVDLP
jgi:hypothetical protein